MIKKTTFLILLIAFSAISLAQQPIRDTLPETGLFQPGKFNYHVTIGSEFTTVSGFGSAFQSYITPRLTYNLNQRLKIGGGISFRQTNYINARSLFGDNSGLRGSNSSFTSALVFIDGEYIVNDRFTIFGSAFKEIPVTRDPLPYNPFSPYTNGKAQGIDFNIGYKMGKHFYIQAGFRYSEGMSPWCNDPFGGTFSGNPYGLK
jgi:hypothetical protein